MAKTAPKKGTLDVNAALKLLQAAAVKSQTSANVKRLTVQRATDPKYGFCDQADPWVKGSYLQIPKAGTKVYAIMSCENDEKGVPQPHQIVEAKVTGHDTFGQVYCRDSEGGFVCRLRDMFPRNEDGLKNATAERDHLYAVVQIEDEREAYRKAKLAALILSKTATAERLAQEPIQALTTMCGIIGQNPFELFKKGQKAPERAKVLASAAKKLRMSKEKKAEVAALRKEALALVKSFEARFPGGVLSDADMHAYLTHQTPILTHEEGRPTPKEQVDLMRDQYAVAGEQAAEAEKAQKAAKAKAKKAEAEEAEEEDETEDDEAEEVEDIEDEEEEADEEEDEEPEPEPVKKPKGRKVKVKVEASKPKKAGADKPPSRPEEGHYVKIGSRRMPIQQVLTRQLVLKNGSKEMTVPRRTKFSGLSRNGTPIWEITG